MKLQVRKKIAKIKPLHKMARLVMYNSGYVYYRTMYRRKNYAEVFSRLKGSMAGKRCFIVGNGPSLLVEDLERLKDEDCFGVNEIHRIFNQTKWRPKYYVIMDRYSKTTPEQLRDLECNNIFLTDYYCRFNTVLRDDIVCLHQHYNLSEKRFRFSSDISKCIISSPTVSYTAMQIASYLGYSEVYLLGFDHNYSFEFDRKGAVIKTDAMETHFFHDEIPEDIIANVWGMTKAYESFKKYAEENGIVVRNATRGGRLEVFERTDFDSLFRS